MSRSELQKQWASSMLSSGNMAYVDGLYEDYLVDKASVPEEWQAFFEKLPHGEKGQAREVNHRAIIAHFRALAEHPQVVIRSDKGLDKQATMNALIHAYRVEGHFAAKLDPLALTPPVYPPTLELSHYGLSREDEQTLRTQFAGKEMSLAQLLQALRETYCASIGIEYMHLSSDAEKEWFQKRMETNFGKGTFNQQEKLAIFEDLVEADGLERYLGTRFVGQKRFSLEGGDALIPMMKSILDQAGSQEVREIVIGMAHRGRLNVLVNVLGKSPQSLFEEFEGTVKREGTGDVKYHMGFSSDVKLATGAIIHVALGFNPSHLEIIGPVVEGSVRARLKRQHDLVEKNKVVPVLIHGDAAFAGQGVVMETFNFSQARGFCTGGTVHIVVNNQIGFTTSCPRDARSTRYCTDVAKMVEAPVIHVNGDDAEACVFAIQTAFEFRMRFKRDVVVDLMCYRRHGHNEADEPAITQPKMYEKIKSILPLREIYAERLLKEGIIKQEAIQSAFENYRAKLDKGECVVDVVRGEYNGKIANDWGPYLQAKWTDPAKTSVPVETLKRLLQVVHTLPEGFTLHPVVARLMAEREKMLEGQLPLNWGAAETLAYATLLNDGYPIRLCGQDAGRGTFAHRHAVLHDFKTAEPYIPLKKAATSEDKNFVVIDSVLSEEAVLAFEYGYACSDPTSLVLWEAQFGDFANGAQVVIDQFISSGEQKWGRLCGLVMLLPHGYEGQGPEHSSARLERYMQLCAQHNMQVCVPTTPAQIFHLLRRQMIRPFRKPLIIMTPKSLLRHKLAVSALSDLATGEFQCVIPECDTLDPKQVKRVIICSGKVYYDLLQKRREAECNTVAIIRIEQLYPFPEEQFLKVLAPYAHVQDVVWCQEEPENQGAWFASWHHIRRCLGKESQLIYAGRSFAASPAVGSLSLHTQQQETLVKEALGL